MTDPHRFPGEPTTRPLGPLLLDVHVALANAGAARTPGEIRRARQAIADAVPPLMVALSIAERDAEQDAGVTP